MVTIIGVRFKPNGKVYYFDPGNNAVTTNDGVIVETVRGIEYGEVVFEPKEVDEEKIVPPLKSIIRVATDKDLEKLKSIKEEEKKAFDICLEKIAEHELNMKLIDSEYTFDKTKLLFYFFSDKRIDFRELVKDLASIFHTRIELRQIGVRDETKLIGGYGICGRPFCCTTFLTDFSPVSIKMAKDQGLSLNPSKISGVCGRLMCCLKNEEAAYEELNKALPNIGQTVKTIDGFTGEVQSLSVLKQRVKVILETDTGDKEVREYPASELSFGEKKASRDYVATIPDDEKLDDNILKELEMMENADISDLEAEEAENNSSHQTKKKKPFKKNHNANNSNKNGNNQPSSSKKAVSQKANVTNNNNYTKSPKQKKNTGFKKKPFNKNHGHKK